MLGQHKANIAVVPYQSGWKDLYEREADLLYSTLGAKALRIEHIGSTAIPGMDAKPIIDIMVAVVSLTQATELIPVVESLGYEYRTPDLVPERIFFVKESSPKYRTHHLNLTPQESGFWKNQLAFRDYLRAHGQVASEYRDLKKRLAEDYAHTHKLDPDGKSEFVTRVLELAEKEEMEELNMESFHEYMNEYKKQLKKGDIQQAYKGLMEYFRDLRSHFKNEYPDYFVSSSIYYGYMDMTYFSFFPKSLKRRKLKIAIVFIHDTFRFEVWLAGINKNVQTKYWKLLKESDWNKYHIASTTRGVDYIIDYILIDNPDFSDLDTLTKQIERGTLKFIKDVEGFLSKH